MTPKRQKRGLFGQCLFPAILRPRRQRLLAIAPQHRVCACSCTTPRAASSRSAKAACLCTRWAHGRVVTPSSPARPASLIGARHHFVRRCGCSEIFGDPGNGERHAAGGCEANAVRVWRCAHSLAGCAGGEVQTSSPRKLRGRRIPTGKRALERWLCACVVCLVSLSNAALRAQIYVGRLVRPIATKDIEQQAHDIRLFQVSDYSTQHMRRQTELLPGSGRPRATSPSPRRTRAHRFLSCSARSVAREGPLVA